MRRTPSVIVAVLIATRLGAQSPAARPSRAWVSAGLGYGVASERTISYLASGWYSRGTFAIGARTGGVGALFGERRSERSLLAGATLGSSHDFLLGAVGIGRVASGYSTSDSRHAYPAVTAVSYSLEAHPKSDWGLGMTMFGALGPASARYTGFAITVNPGWFGD